MSDQAEDLDPIDFGIALQNQLSERARKAAEGVSRVYSRRQIEQAFLESFDLIGGIPRLAIWANDEKNYGVFLQLLMKLSPKEAAARTGAAVLEYRSNIPSSPLVRNEKQSAHELEQQQAIEGEFDEV